MIYHPYRPYRQHSHDSLNAARSHRRHFCSGPRASREASRVGQLPFWWSPPWPQAVAATYHCGPLLVDVDWSLKIHSVGRRNKPIKDDAFDEFWVCGVFGYTKYTTILDGFYVFSCAPPRVKRKFIKIRLTRARALQKGPRTRARVQFPRCLKFVFGNSQVFEEVPSVLTKSGVGEAYFNTFLRRFLTSEQINKNRRIWAPL